MNRNSEVEKEGVVGEAILKAELPSSVREGSTFMGQYRITWVDPLEGLVNYSQHTHQI